MLMLWPFEVVCVLVKAACNGLLPLAEHRRSRSVHTLQWPPSAVGRIGRRLYGADWITSHSWSLKFASIKADCDPEQTRTAYASFPVSQIPTPHVFSCFPVLSLALISLC